MQAKLARDEAEFRRRDQAPMRDPHSVKRPVEIGAPEAEKIRELRKARDKVVVLPKIALQQFGVVRQAVKDFRRGEREAF